MRFLYNTWLYLDVLSSLSSGEDPYSLNFIPQPNSPSSPLSDRSPPPSFSLQNEIDSLLGCAAELFPLIARMSRVSNRLSGKVIDTEHLEWIEEGIQVRNELRDWRPPDTSILQESQDIHCSLDDIVRTAEVYRLSSLLHLYRGFPALGNKQYDVLADQILEFLLLIPADSRSLCVHIWPLMAAGCEIREPSKRERVLERFEVIRESLRVANVDQAINLLGEVWHRRDLGDQDAGWPILASERGWNMFLG